VSHFLLIVIYLMALAVFLSQRDEVTQIGLGVYLMLKFGVVVVLQVL
jgi:hypothetical protein